MWAQGKNSGKSEIMYYLYNKCHVSLLIYSTNTPSVTSIFSELRTDLPLTQPDLYLKRPLLRTYFIKIGSYRQILSEYP
jgi:hypothetical protein